VEGLTIIVSIICISSLYGSPASHVGGLS